MIRQIRASDCLNRAALEGKIFAVRVVSFTPGDSIAFNDASSSRLIYAACPTYRRRRGFERIYLFPGAGNDATRLIIEATEDIEEQLDPASGLQVDPITGRLLIATGNTQLPTIVAAGSTSGIIGADFNSDDWAANNVRYTNWVDVSSYIALQLISNFQSLAGINGADTVAVQVEWSSNGLEAVGAVPMATSTAGVAGIMGASPASSRFWVGGRYARFKLTKGAAAGPHRLRVQWFGQNA
jgi:hypothetical protein